ncbi:type II toxin-antitoxin system Phd/YefM family antitoxin [Bacillus sp. N9]
MKVNSTEVQNNFGKFLMLAGQEEIIITRNGTEIAKLTAIKEPSSTNNGETSTVRENASEYSYGGKRQLTKSFCNCSKKMRRGMSILMKKFIG